MPESISGECAIKFVGGPLRGQLFPLQKAEITIGRDAHNDIVVLDPRVSRNHASLRWEQGQWFVINLSQKSIITIEQRIVQKEPLHENVPVVLGEDTTFIFLRRNASSSSAYIPLMQAGSGAMPVLSASAPIAPTPSPSSAKIPAPGSSTGWIASPIAPGAVVEKTMLHGIPSIVVSSNNSNQKQIYPLEKPVITIGRHAANDIVIKEQIISSYHFRIEREGGHWILTHPAKEKTLNGLLYQGRHIKGFMTFRKELENGDIFRIGDEHGTLITLTFDDGSGMEGQTLPDVRPLPLGMPVITIGRHPDNTVVLEHPQVSAHHARLEQVAGGQYRVTDLNSTNHVYVNAARVTSQMLRPGDEIRIGPFRFEYSGEQLVQYDESNSIRIDALHLNKVGHRGTVLLNDISLSIPPRTFVALVGSSGAGKSTLMDALNGLRPAGSGQVFYNGQDYYRHQAAFSTQLGYVPQDDIVHRNLTVQRALFYAARMRLPSDYTHEQIQQRIEEVLEEVEMMDRRNLLVSKLSGGQRKRVSIALELLAKPSVFFLDEPTSGLDPGLDRKMMLLLRRLADRGHTIVLVTHATNNINVCDYVCFLAQGGRLVYYGPPDEARTYFRKADFAEIYSALEPTKDNPDVPAQAETGFRNSQAYKQYVEHHIKEGELLRVHGKQQGQLHQHIKRGNPFTQFRLLTLRYLELLRNDPGNLLLLLLQAPVVALLLVLMANYGIGQDLFRADKVVTCQSQLLTKTGPLSIPNTGQGQKINCNRVMDFLQHDPAGKLYAHDHGGALQALQEFILPASGTDAQNVLFIMTFAAVLFGCLSGSREIVKEIHIFRREHAVNLGIVPYMFSKVLVLGVLALFQSAVLVLFVNVTEPYHQGVLLPPLLEVYITITLCEFAGLMIGLTISAVAPNSDWAISFVPIIVLPQVIFAGLIIPFKDWFTQGLAAIFPTRWTLTALGTSVGLHSDKLGKDMLFGNDYTFHGTLFSTYNHSDAVSRLTTAWIALGVLSAALIMIIGLALSRKHTH